MAMLTTDIIKKVVFIPYVKKASLGTIHDKLDYEDDYRRMLVFSFFLYAYSDVLLMLLLVNVSSC